MKENILKKEIHFITCPYLCILHEACGFTLSLGRKAALTQLHLLCILPSSHLHPLPREATSTPHFHRLFVRHLVLWNKANQDAHARDSDRSLVLKCLWILARQSWAGPPLSPRSWPSS